MSAGTGAAIQDIVSDENPVRKASNLRRTVSGLKKLREQTLASQTALEKRVRDLEALLSAQREASGLPPVASSSTADAFREPLLPVTSTPEQSEGNTAQEEEDYDEDDEADAAATLELWVALSLL